MPVPAQIEFRTHTRLTGLDYRSSYGYFVTICVRNRECIFGTIADNVMSLSRRGMIVCDSWLDIPNHHSHVELDAFIILPNHIHGILLFVGDSPSVGATPASRSS